MKGERLQFAEGLLQEAVFRSRAAQAAGVGLAGGALDREPEPGGCGLGAKAVLELELTPRGAELFAALWPDAPGPEEVERLRLGLAAWVSRQDGLDRKRNHFLRDFRSEHGADRNAYSPEQRTAFQVGLEAVNAEENAKRRDAATALLTSEG